jgi:hypothetical protein
MLAAARTDNQNFHTDFIVVETNPNKKSGAQEAREGARFVIFIPFPSLKIADFVIK